MSWEWSRADLPSLAVCQAMGLGYTSNDKAAASVVLDTVVEHLNEQHPKPSHAEPSWDAEDCDACTEVQDACGFHRGMAAGVVWMSERLAAIAADPELMNLIPNKVLSDRGSGASS